MSIEDIKAGNIEEYLGTLQQSMVESWKEHLKTDKYSKHKALNDFYDDIIDLVDALVEDYQGIYGKVGDLKNNFKAEEIGAIEYLELLREFAIQGREDFLDEKDTELYSDVDAILSCIDGCLYQLKELKESRMINLSDYLTEALLSEAEKKFKDPGCPCNGGCDKADRIEDEENAKKAKKESEKQIDKESKEAKAKSDIKPLKSSLKESVVNEAAQKYDNALTWDLEKFYDYDGDFKTWWIEEYEWGDDDPSKKDIKFYDDLKKLLKKYRANMSVMDLGNIYWEEEYNSLHEFMEHEANMDKDEHGFILNRDGDDADSLVCYYKGEFRPSDKKLLDDYIYAYDMCPDIHVAEQF